MRTALALAALALPLTAWSAQEQPKKQDPSRSEVEVTGCVRGSMLTETNLRIAGAADEQPTRRWRLRGPKSLMNQIKQHEGRELAIEGTTKNAESASVAGKRIGKTNIYIGGDPQRTSREPLPDLPTIEVERFDLTGEQCR